MSEPWTEEELAWARECYASGDTLQEIADDAGRSREDVRQALGALAVHLTVREREVLRLYSAGVSLPEIDRGRGNYADPGKAAAMLISSIRRKGLPVPHRRNDLREKAA